MTTKPAPFTVEESHIGNLRIMQGPSVFAVVGNREDAARILLCLNAHPALVAALQKHHDAAWLHHANHGCPICDLDGTRLCPLLTESAAALAAAKGAT